MSDQSPNLFFVVRTISSGTLGQFTVWASTTVRRLDLARTSHESHFWSRWPAGAYPSVLCGLEPLTRCGVEEMTTH